ncbi:MAG: DUF294 nucleotidyltransferase-like domain-containing protein, partial [Acidobacteriota bacterium]
MHARDLFLSEKLTSREVQAILSPYGFQNTEQVDGRLQRIADMVGVRERFAGLAPGILLEASRSADPDAAILRLEAFFEVVPSASNLASYLSDSPSAVEALVQILGSSSFLTQLLVRNPEYFYWLMEAGRLLRTEDADYFRREATGMIQPFTDAATKLDALRRFRRRESLRIAAQDVLNRSKLEDTLSQVTSLADTILQSAFEILAAHMLADIQGFAVLGMGKLGGRELNYSSDVDLLYVYSDEDQRPLMLKFAREYTRVLNDYTDQGRLYRVDLRLRPMGKSGQIAYSADAYRHYYETWADTFDRLALIKCRRVAGDAELGDRFVESVQDFVFKKYLDHAAVEEVRWLKKKTDRELRLREESHRNIKLGLGGIREIEFFVQAFQLLYGGVQPDIRAPSTLGALDRLVDHGFISHGDHTVLGEAYRFLRDLEHKLQLVQDQQTHLLPLDEAEVERCARRMGLASVENFRQTLDLHNQNVRRIFDSLFDTKEKTGGLEELALNLRLTRDDALEILVSRGVQCPDQVWEGIKMLQEVSAFPHSPSRMRNLVANLLPRLIEGLDFIEQPRALFNRFDRFSDSLGSRASLYTEMVENPEFSRRLLQVISTGDFLAEILIRNPELLDSISKLPNRPPDPKELRQRAAGADARKSLRLFKQREEFKTALLDLFVPDSTLENRRRLSRIADICIRQACENVLVRKPKLKKESFALFSLGKLGGEELTYHSDLDLIFVYDDRESAVIPDEFDSFLKEFRLELEEYTEAGRAYQLDLRLRPEGKHGPLVTPRSSIENYFKGRAEDWERLAYVK